MGWLSRLTERFAAPAPASDEQILARLLPMWQSARPLPQPHDYRAYAQDGYRRNAIIFACITEISTSAAEPPLQALRLRGEEAVPLPATDPLSLLMARPNPEQSRYELLSLVTTHLHVAGNAYLHKVRARNGKPVQLWPLRPDRIEIKPGRNGLIESYAYSIGGQPTFIPAEDVVHFKMHPDPLDDYYGLSPISVLARFGDLDNSATDFLRAFFLNAGVPGGLLTFKSGRVGKDERERVRQSWRDQFSTSKGWHDVGVMDADVTYQELGSVPRKLDLSTVWGVTESRICMVFGVPAVLVGAWIGLQNSTFANYETAQKSLWQETLLPFYVRLADKLTMGVASEFGADRLVRFDLSKVQALQENRALKEERARKNWENGLLTMNEARIEQGYTEVPDGDMRKAPAFSPFPAPVQQRRIFSVAGRHALPKFVDNAPDDPFYLAVHKIADRLTPELRDAFLRGVLAMDGGIDQATLIAAVESGDMERAFAAIPFEAFTDSLKSGGGDVLLRAIAEAGASAALTLQDTHGLTITFDLTNPRAQQFAATQTATMVTEVTEGTKEAIRAIIERGFSEGLTPQQMAMEIRQVVGLTTRQMQAVVNFRGSLIADGITGDALDTRVGKYAQAQLQYRGTMIARQECLSGETVVDGAVILAVYRRWYDGEIAEITTSDGRKFTTTPNHPMLTNRGWMAADHVHEGDDLICNAWEQNAGAPSDPDITRPPTTIAQIFDTVAAVGILEGRICTQPDFHGDGQEGQVEIARPFWPLSIGEFTPLYEPTIKQVLSPADLSRTPLCDSCHRLLSIDQQPCLCAVSSSDSIVTEAPPHQAVGNIEHPRDMINGFSREVASGDLHSRDVGSKVIRSTSPLKEQGAGGRERSDCQPGTFDGLEHSVGIDPQHCSDSPGAHTRQIHLNNSLVIDSVSSHGCLGTRTEGHPGIAYPHSNAGTISPNYASDFSTGEPGQVKLDRVLSVVLRKWSGHVFNLSTPFGYFTIDGVYTGNTLSASNAGQRELWMQASEKGLLPSDQEREWILTPDGRLCPNCERMDGARVKLNEPWQTPAGPVMIPQQIHPTCRCAQGLVIAT